MCKNVGWLRLFYLYWQCIIPETLFTMKNLFCQQSFVRRSSACLRNGDVFQRIIDFILLVKVASFDFNRSCHRKIEFSIILCSSLNNPEDYDIISTFFSEIDWYVYLVIISYLKVFIYIFLYSGKIINNIISTCQFDFSLLYLRC